MTKPRPDKKPESLHHSRPFSVTLLSLGVLTLAGVNLIRLVQTLLQWQFLQSLLSFSPVYLAITGFVWAALGLAVSWGLWRGHAWARQWTIGGMLAYGLYYWLDRLFLSNHADRSANRIFAICATVLIVLIILWILTRRSAKAFFGETHEQ